MKITINGKQVEATEVDFITRKEDFNEYQLADGKRLLFKAVVTDVVIIEGEKDNDGNPMYQVRAQNIVRIK
jgi:hypothetical protein